VVPALISGTQCPVILQTVRVRVVNETGVAIKAPHSVARKPRRGKAASTRRGPVAAPQSATLLSQIPAGLLEGPMIQELRPRPGPRCDRWRESVYAGVREIRHADQTRARPRLDHRSRHVSRQFSGAERRSMAKCKRRQRALLRSRRHLARRELAAGFNVISTEMCGGGPGSGPYLGLCASDPTSLILQLTIPPGTLPFRFVSNGTTQDFGPYPGIPAGLTVDAITLDIAGPFWRFSAVDRITFQ
jgi:hypothetical protein